MTREIDKSKQDDTLKTADPGTREDFYYDLLAGYVDSMAREALMKGRRAEERDMVNDVARLSSNLKILGSCKGYFKDDRTFNSFVSGLIAAHMEAILETRVSRIEDRFNMYLNRYIQHIIEESV